MYMQLYIIKVYQVFFLCVGSYSLSPIRCHDHENTYNTFGEIPPKTSYRSIQYFSYNTEQNVQRQIIENPVKIGHVCT